MKCEDFRSKMFEYLNSNLSQPFLDEMEEHRNTCIHCNMEIHAWEENAEWIPADDIEVDLSHISIAESVMSRIRQEERWAYPLVSRFKTIPKRWIPWLSFAAVLLIAIFSISIFADLSQQNLISNQFSSLPKVQYAVGVQEIGIADTNITTSQSIPIAGMVASIGQPLTNHDLYDESSASHLLQIISFLGLLFLMLMMNWLSRQLEP